jgi:hypothetical protein
MSWLADRNATSSASAPISPRLTFGSHQPSASVTAMRGIWIERPQPRRRPIGIGGGSRSISGDHRNLKAYGVPTSANAPIVLRLTPAFANQAESVEAVSSKGRPLAKPSGRINITRRSAYCAIDCRQPVRPRAPSGTAWTGGMLPFIARTGRAARKKPFAILPPV